MSTKGGNPFWVLKKFIVCAIIDSDKFISRKKKTPEDFVSFGGIYSSKQIIPEFSIEM